MAFEARALARISNAMSKPGNSISYHLIYSVPVHLLAVGRWQESFVKLITRNARAHRSKLIIIMGTTQPLRGECSVCVPVTRLSFVKRHDWLIKHECLPLVVSRKDDLQGWINIPPLFSATFQTRHPSKQRRHKSWKSSTRSGRSICASNARGGRGQMCRYISERVILSRAFWTIMLFGFTWQRKC